MRDLSNDHSLLAINSATVEAVDPASSSSKPARAPASRRSRRGATVVQAAGVEQGRQLIRDAGLTVTGYCRGGMFPPPTRPAAARRSTTTAARSTKPPRSARPVWCWSPAACRRARKDIAGAHAQVDDGIAALLPYARERRRAACDRAAASDVRRRPRLREHARARQRPLRPARRRHRRISASRSTPITCGGTLTSRRRSRAPASASWPFMSATGWCRPRTSCSTAACRATASSISARSAPWSRRPATTAPSTSRFSRRRTGGSASPAEVLRICLERHQTVV